MFLFPPSCKGLLTGPAELSWMTSYMLTNRMELSLWVRELGCIRIMLQTGLALGDKSSNINKFVMYFEQHLNQRI